MAGYQLFISEIKDELVLFSYQGHENLFGL